jgi:hypothetical protein
MPKPVPFQPWIELIRQPARDRVGKLEIGMTNRTNQTWSLYGGTPSPYGGGGSDAGVWAGPNPSEIKDGCPRGAATAENAISNEMVKPRQSTSETYSIYVIHDKGVCFASGEHRFPGHRQVFESQADEDPALAFKWWFTLFAE